MNNYIHPCSVQRELLIERLMDWYSNVLFDMSDEKLMEEADDRGII